jgi:hypothetical protein
MYYVNYITGNHTATEAYLVYLETGALPEPSIPKIKTLCVPSINPPKPWLVQVVDLAKVLYQPTEFYSTRQHYHTFTIPKASGGLRTITAPNPYLKEKQRGILDVLQNQMHILPHDASHAFSKGRGITTAIQQHQANESMYFLKVDIEDFFGSITRTFLRRTLQQIYPLCCFGEFVDLVVGWGTLDGVLPQGAPTSPLLANLVMVPIDNHITNLLKSHGEFVYTRYADDLLISSKHPFRFKPIIKAIETAFEIQQAPLRLNHSKTRYGTRRGRIWNLGIMLNKDNQMTIGYKGRAKLRAHTFNILKEIQQEPMTLAKIHKYMELQGKIAHAVNVNADILSMIQKVEMKAGITMIQARAKCRVR